MTAALTLHGYWRSSAAYRVRIALNLKGVDYAQVSHDLTTGAQRQGDYLAIAPHGLVPALETGGTILIESSAILEWIEATWPTPPLLPESADEAAIVRSMAALIGCDIHPLNNLRVLNRLRADFNASEEQVRAWIHHWIEAGFGPLEQMVAQHGGGFAFGDAPTMADCYTVPQLYNARRFGVDLSPYPRLIAAGEAATSLPAVEAAHPERQPDAA
ncbi:MULTISPECIES: maleylacetoacetate isomerase [Sphingobium]|uniref:Maleylacetoacetate isomerase n=1 Tax=Sphingobium tyrosinilyticum TaxID=2715436 RepID=A0ABV9F2N2_9SPHN|nr:maleylacetoacetate isomerase [Sphingobium sp. EP60837]ANI80001.1 Maleylpyruvate isomerase [Sphingobium sp. EP60837]